MKIGLSMIVKNEAHIIERCLTSVSPLIDYVLIVDTGSTDDTIQKCTSWIRQYSQGQVISEPWQDFAYNRSFALEKMREIKDIDYVLTIDADEVISYKHEPTRPVIEKFKAQLHHDVYSVENIMSDIVFSREQLFSNKKRFIYKGVVHEYLACLDKIESKGLVEDFGNYPIQDSHRNKSGHKLEIDIKVLKSALQTEKDPYLRSRYTFYLAQSLLNCQKSAEALQYYQQQIQMDGDAEETFYSFFQIAVLKETLKYPQDEIMQSYLKAYEVRPSRAEPLYRAMCFARNCQLYQQGYMLAKHALQIPCPTNDIFVDSSVYEYRILDEFSTLAFQTGRYQECIDACKKLLEENKLPKEDAERIKKNLVGLLIAFHKDTKSKT